MADNAPVEKGGLEQPPFSSLHHQNKWRGIGLFLIAVTAISATNACVKWASIDHHTIDILFYRNAVALLIAAFYIRIKYGEFSILKTNRPFDHARRGILGTIGVGTAFAAFAVMPMANATVLLFTIPLFTALLSMPVLGEKVGPYRWLAIFAGFVGVVIAINPDNPFSWYGVTMALTSAITSAFVALYIRDLGKSEPVIRTVFYFLLIGTLILLPFMPFVATMPVWPMLILLLMTGVLGFVNQTLKTQAFAIAPAAMLSPLLYTMLIWSVLFDWLIWKSAPSPSVLLGGAIIIASNLFLLWREKVKSDP